MTKRKAPGGSEPGKPMHVYAEVERDNALDLMRLNSGALRKTALQLNIAPDTLTKFVKEAGLEDEMRALRRSNRPNRLDDVIEDIIDRIEEIALTGDLAQCANAVRTLHMVKGMINPGDGNSAMEERMPENLSREEVKRRLTELTHQLQKRKHEADEREEKAV